MIRPYWRRDGTALYHGDCLDVLAAMEPESVDAVVTDPPYGLEFMGVGWDTLRKGAPRTDTDFDVLHSKEHPRKAEEQARIRHKKNLSAQRFHHAWAEAALRVLKPGGHLVAFGSTRTHHRLWCALEDAGFEIRDTLCWLYGQGFPKNLDVSKAIDKAAGAEREVVTVESKSPERPITERWIRSNAKPSAMPLPGQGENSGHLREVTAPATEAARQWDGWGTALKPAWEPIVLARKPLVGTVAANVQAHGTGALNIDGCRIETMPRKTGTRPISNSPTGSGHSLVGSSKKRQAVYDLQNLGRWPPNVALSCTCEETREGRVRSGTAVGGYKTSSSIYGTFMGRKDDAPNMTYADPDGKEAVTAHTDSDCPCAMLDAQSGERASTRANGNPNNPKSGFSGFSGGVVETKDYRDHGGASRFFYIAKASRRERGKGNSHATVKPLTLMRWLVRLVTPPNGLILDPFLGSGTTALAAEAEGFHCIGIEQDEGYCRIAVSRLEAPCDG